MERTAINNAAMPPKVPKPYLHEHAGLIAAGTLSAAVYAYWAVVSQQGNHPTLTPFLFLSSFCALLSFWVCGRYVNAIANVPVALLIGFAVLFRLIGISGDPLFEDDFYRYLWDGRMWLETGTPYGVPPAAFFGDTGLTDRFDDILDQINHPDVATVYGPMNQVLFGLAYLLAPGEVWPLQLMLCAVDMVIVVMLLQLAKPHWVLLYAWSPLVIKEIAFTAHPDILGVALLIGAMLTARDKRWLVTGVLLGLAAASKIFALILVPFILQLQWRGWAAFVGSAMIISLPFGIIPAWVPDGLTAMATDWLFNAPLYFFLMQWFGISQAKLVLFGVFVLGWSVYLFKYTWAYRKDNAASHPVRADLLFAGFFLCLPVINAWYLVWLLPFGVLYPSATVWAASVAVGLSYISGFNTGTAGPGLHELPTWVLISEVAIIGGAVCWDALCSRAKRKHTDQQPRPSR